MHREPAREAFLKAQVNKTDRNDARGIAQMMRVNLFRPVHVKTLTSQKRRALLTARKLLQEKAIAIENDIRGLLRNFGLRVGIVGKLGFDARIRELVEVVPELVEIMAPLLSARKKLREEFARLHRKVLEIAKDDTVCNRLMTIPRCRSCHIARFHQHHRCPGAFPEFAVGRSSARTDPDAQPIWRKHQGRPCLPVWRRDDAIPAL